MKSNKINNVNLFTSAANDTFNKHINTQSKQALEIIKSKIDWEKLLKPIEKIILKQKENNSPAGRRTIDLLVIVKCFILQTIYDLSDPRLEEEIADRRSFQIFLDLNSLDSIPDETTICCYREMFARLYLDKQLFYEFNKQLKNLNLIIGKGTIVDATIKQAQATPGSKRDKDANSTQKRGKTYYGYKGHIAIDEDSEVIKTVEFTKASLHDSNAFEQLIDYTEEAIFADKGYANKNRRKKLERRNIFDGILSEGYRNKSLSQSKIRLNKLLSTVRNKVVVIHPFGKRPFAYMKRILNYQRCNYYDLRRHRFEFIMVALVYNIRKLLTATS